tara:strand:+ start:69 stop:545 length:477 start_codon:yes stop_codon:yes gene_type:complete
MDKIQRAWRILTNSNAAESQTAVERKTVSKGRMLKALNDELSLRLALGFTSDSMIRSGQNKQHLSDLKDTLQNVAGGGAGGGAGFGTGDAQADNASAVSTITWTQFMRFFGGSRPYNNNRNLLGDLQPASTKAAFAEAIALARVHALVAEMRAWAGSI